MKDLAQHCAFDKETIALNCFGLIHARETSVTNQPMKDLTQHCAFDKETVALNCFGFIHARETSVTNPGRVAQSVTCLATDVSLTAFRGVAPGPILSWRLIMKSFLRSFSSLPLSHSRRDVVSYKRKYVHEVLVNCLFKLAQEKVW